MGSGRIVNLKFTTHFFETLPSTQSLAREWAEQRLYSSGDIIVAATQTGGYGRRGRTWESPSGNLFATLIVDPPSHDALNWMGFVTSLALYDVAKAYVPTPQELCIKWPNDLMVDGKKLAGILLEVAGEVLLVGIGVNLVVAPHTDQQTVCLAPNKALTPEVFLYKFFPRFSHWYEQAQSKGFGAVREAWLQRSFLKPQQEITARIADGRVLVGKFLDLDTTGALVLQASDKTHTITAADIFISHDHERQQTSAR